MPLKNRLSITRLVLPVIIFLVSCSNREKAANNSDFQISYVDLSTTGNLYRMYTYNNLIIGMFFDKKFFVIDSNYKHSLDIEEKLNSLPPVSDVFFYKNDILFMLDTNKIVVFDSAFNRKKDVEISLNHLNPTGLLYNRDSLYLYNSTKMFLITNRYTTTFIDSVTFFKRHSALSLKELVYSDSVYNVYACGVGEFGGNVFFQNKRNLQTYSFPTYFNDLFYHKNSYYLIQGDKNWSEYTRIKDPTKLFQITVPNKFPFCCNCDSGYKKYFYEMSKAEQKKWDKQKGVTTYFDTNHIQTLTTFIEDSNLYSLCMTDSAFVILQHDDTVKIIESIPKFDKRINCFSTILKAGNSQRKVVGLGSGYTQLLDSSGLDREFDELGVIIINGHKIDIYESYNTKLVKAERIGN